MIGRTLLIAAVVAALAGPAAAQVPFKLQIVDSATGRGTPLVEVKAPDGTTWYTDSNGIVAIDEPAQLGQTLQLSVASYGYQSASHTISTVPGGSAEQSIVRTNRAERLYRVTGQGIYADSVQVGAAVPIAKPLLNANVTGQDSVQTAVYKGQIFWVWGDTNYVGGGFNLRVSAATSQMPGQGGLDPSEGVNLNYFTAANGNAKQMMPISEPGLVWLDALFTLNDNDGRERLLAHYSRIVPLPENQFNMAEHGLAMFNDATQTFQRLQVYDLDAPIVPWGHDMRHTVNGEEYLYFVQPYANVRVKANWNDVTDLAKWEAYTPLQENSRYTAQNPPLERDGQGKLVFDWKHNADPFGREMLNEMIQRGQIDRSSSPFRLKELGSGKTIDMQRSSIQWNDYRQNWIMIGQEAFGQSFLGEIWFAEAPTPEGPWENAVKVVTHYRPGATYSFYNPALHPYFDQEGGRYVYFEGTYTAWLGSAPETPLYDYNQMMYRLDLSTIPSLTRLGGDFDGDGDADGADFLIWQRTYGATPASNTGADANGNGRVEAADLEAWKLRFGASAAPFTAMATLVVAEPAAGAMALAGLLLIIARKPCGRLSNGRAPRRIVT